MVARSRQGSGRLAALLLLGCWIAGLLIPLLPAMDPRAWDENLKPLLLYPDFELDAFIRDVAAWLAVACLGAVLFGGRWMPIKLVLLATAVLGLRIVVSQNDLDFTDVAAAGAAVLMFGILVNYLPRRDLLVALILLASYVFLGLSPFEIRPESTAIVWLPFQNPTWDIAADGAYKVFLFGASIWLLWRGGLNLGVASVFTTLVAGAVEFGQTRMGQGAPGSTDVLLAVMAAAAVAILIRVRGPGPGIEAQTTPPRQAEPTETPPPVVAEDEIEYGKVPWPAIGARFVLALVLVFGGLALAVGLSFTPYDFAALFRIEGGAGGGIIEQLAVALGLISIGLGAGLTARRLAVSRRPYFSLPGWILLTALISYLLFLFGLSNATMAGLTGPATFFEQLRDGSVFGDWGVDTVAALGPGLAQGLLAIVEPFVRFSALMIPLSLSLALFGAAFWQLERFPNLSGFRQMIFLAVCLALYGLGGLPILLLCKFIAFDVSSHELIPVLVPEWGGAGMGGGLYLYLLLAVVSFTVAWLAWSLRRPRPVRLVFGLLLLAMAPPVGWWLVQRGILPKVQFANLNVPPLRLWLAPEANGMIDDQIIFVRWNIAQFAVMGILLLGAVIPSGPARRIPIG
ncbi:MAG: hypothetical protein VCD66_01460 [Alphaproteobacteria bacterium]